MFFDDHKKQITTVLARRSPKGEPLAGPAPMKMEINKEEPGEVDGRHVAAQDIIAALHEKSPQKLMETLGNFIDIHRSKETKQEAESE
jgi:hypothetical protein